ncbi:hypothetical protein [Deinococcus pimensis]|uniref:hypothetical protein n=1 Tax=Deinococcus pimensis TaxID=309888 RepID=UPI000483E9A1|nr:hypothetical protein [Deinococcus pimensis]
MKSFKRSICGVAMVGMTLLGAASRAQTTAPDRTVFSGHLPELSGVALSGSECRRRMERLERLLREAGYTHQRTYVNEDRLLMASWYDSRTKTTVIAYAGQLEAGNAFSAAALPGVVSWKEFIALP